MMMHLVHSSFTIIISMTKERIFDIKCPKCGAPASFDIPTQKYLCSFCDGEVGIQDAILQTQGYRSLQHKKLKDDVKKFKLLKTSCTGCGSELLFEENEPLSNCAFCGRNVVRHSYLEYEEMPESVIPFGITKEEAKRILEDWCKQNKNLSEAKHIHSLIDSLQAFYLPYELLHGPVHMNVSRIVGSKKFPCEGFLMNTFVNRSQQLDNILLDGMEPFDTEALVPFDFSYVAGHGVKVSDISDQDLEKRVREETRSTYTPFVQKTLESKAVDIDVYTSSLIRLPVLLPVYYIAHDHTMMAMNGQTGKISVRAEKESRYYFMPWWLKAILYTLLVSAIVYGAFRLFGMEKGSSLYITGLLAIFFIVVTLCANSDYGDNGFSVSLGHKIYTSKEKTFHREKNKLVMNESILERKVYRPIFFENINGKDRPVTLRFTTPLRIIGGALLILVVLFFPVLLALLVNGFQFSKINLGGSAVWFCIMVPVIPIYVLMYVLTWFYNHPWIYYKDEKGRTRRYKKKREFHIPKGMIKDILIAFIKPPICFAIWFGIICFIVMVFLTAGFE